MGDTNQTSLTAALLRDYSKAALENAQALLDEAAVLLRHGHRARTYFLAVASIEETGKAFLAFDGRGRNLSDPAVETKLRRSLESHPSKINAAFAAWLMASPNVRDSVMPAIDLIIALTHGREPSMYTDIDPVTGQIQRPSNVIRDVAAKDSVRLAAKCLGYAKVHIDKDAPTSRTQAEDQLFSMKSAHLQQILNTEDFWWFYIAEMQSGKVDFAASVGAYRRDYALKDRRFRAPRDDA